MRWELIILGTKVEKIKNKVNVGLSNGGFKMDLD